MSFVDVHHLLLCSGTTLNFVHFHTKKEQQLHPCHTQADLFLQTLCLHII